MRVGRGNVLSSQYHAHRDFEWYVTRQAMHSARGRHQANSRFRESEARVLRCDNYIARERYLESTAEREAVNRRDDWFENIVARGDSRAAALAAQPLDNLAAGVG